MSGIVAVSVAAAAPSLLSMLAATGGMIGLFGAMAKLADKANASRLSEWEAQSVRNASYARQEALNRRLNTEVSGLRSEIRQMTYEQNRRLLEQAENFNGVIADLKSQMEKDREALQNAVMDIASDIEEKESNHRKIAELWVSQAEAFFSDIEQYRHELFTPGQLQKLKDHLALTSVDMRNEAFQAAAATSRDVFAQAAELKDRVVKAEMEWNYYCDKFQQALAETKSNLNYLRTMSFTVATENGDETIDANINYWTGDALEAVNAEEERICKITEQIDQIPTQKLIDFTEELNQMNRRMETAEKKAKEALILSQVRAEMASTLAGSLAECGWECDGITYEGGEQNQPVHVKLSDGIGNEIVVVITPDSNMTNNMEINFFDPKNNDEEQRKIWIASIQNSLKESGLEVGAPVCREGYENAVSDNNSIRDIEATAAKKPGRLK